MRRCLRGMTLIEMVVVLVIAGVMLSLVAAATLPAAPDGTASLDSLRREAARAGAPVVTVQDGDTVTVLPDGSVSGRGRDAWTGAPR